jgi:hypothetical protein
MTFAHRRNATAAELANQGAKSERLNPEPKALVPLTENILKHIGKVLPKRSDQGRHIPTLSRRGSELLRSEP